MRFSSGESLFSTSARSNWDGTLLDSYAADSRAYLSCFAPSESRLSQIWRATILRIGIAYIARRACLGRNWTMATGNGPWSTTKKGAVLSAGARAVISMLGREFRLAIVTSGNRIRVRRQLREFALANLFSACVCAETP